MGYMILELNNIDKSFGEKEVLKGVSFTAEGSDFWAETVRVKRHLSVLL